MKARRLFVTAAAPVAFLLSAAGAAHAAAPKVSFRVEGATKTLLETKTVTPPGSGSITKGGTPSGSCSADSAAGALSVATHGDWNGTYSSGLGIEVTSILGTTAQYARGSYWEFFVDGHSASTGICDTKLASGAQYLFAQVPAKGKAELPLEVSAPKTVKAGHAFTLKSWVYPGKGNAERAVKVIPKIVGNGRSNVSREAAGATRITFRTPGTYTVSASATGEIRSAPVTVTVTK